MSGFWRTWFLVWCLSIGLFGVVLAGGALPATDGAVRVVLALTHGPTEPLFDPPLRFSLGVMGGVSIGWAVMLHFVLQEAIRQGAAGRPLWNAISAGMITWFVIDSTLSVATGYGLNVVPNIGLLGMYVVGLMRSGALKAAD
ncbi:MAG: hypothetical protein WCO83_14200 [Alphaproteobacteria bacterium]